MGLCISKQIVEQFNGQITIKSRAGKGTRFTFWFELDDLETNQNQNLKKLENINSLSRLIPQLKMTQKIIVVDDEPFNVQAIIGLMKVLKMQNLDKLVDTCQDGTETVELIEMAI